MKLYPSPETTSPWYDRNPKTRVIGFEYLNLPSFWSLIDTPYTVPDNRVAVCRLVNITVESTTPHNPPIPFTAAFTYIDTVPENFDIYVIKNVVFNTNDFYEAQVFPNLYMTAGEKLYGSGTAEAGTSQPRMTFSATFTEFDA